MTVLRVGFATPFAVSQDYVAYDFLKAIKEAGYDYVELPGTQIGKMDEASFLDLCRFLERIGLSCERVCALLPGTMNCFLTDRAIFDQYLDLIFGRFHLLGVQAVGFGSGAARNIPEVWSRERAVETFMKILQESFLPRMEKYQISLNMEPLREEETNFLHTVAETVQFLKKMGDSRFGVVADTMHMMTMREDPNEVATQYMEWIQHFHISELGRKLPADSYSVDCLTFVKSFKEHGYRKTVSFETKCETVSDLSSAIALLKAI